MNQYVALLRGIGPGNPNMRNDKLRGVFESLGFTNVRSVISSGNILFESDSTDIEALQTNIESALTEQLSINSTAIIRRRDQLQAIVDRDPFQGIERPARSNLNVTFLKQPTRSTLKFPHRPPGKEWELLSLEGDAICSVIDLSVSRTPDLMTWLEREFGKGITTRTYATVGRILSKF